ncbi:methyltransferase domain-containing protein [Gemmata sp. G18]|uniref:Methyltransferase domain-containing protein n=1 Tax=Gemmata palustris TaxID=2822762 RepID=A0ABS5C3C6_9BACT|nr:methyltransferase domain-containing protein [Gemmata palustris]MBP3960472.1 methyltransferase domain-containing protein [Gemmata palustris]
MEDRVYSEKFFSDHVAGSRQSAHVIVPMVLDLIHPKSVVDVGCGLGAWLAVFAENGVTDIMGIDVDYIDRSHRLIAEDKFRPIDLNKPFKLDRSFDLVVCLEVAEHLPESSAEGFVSSLVAIGGAVLFSAAIPGQGGTNHINEQWQVYWRDQFLKCRYELVDCFRPLIWENDRVQVHYRQNMFLYVDATILDSMPGLVATRAKFAGHPLSIVHPALWEVEHMNTRPTIGSLLREFPRAALRSVRKRFLKK